MSTNDDKGKEGDQGKGKEGEGGKPVVFEEWLKAQPADVQTLLTTHTSGLTSALEKERTDRKKFETQLREAAKKLDAGSEAEKSLTTMADQLATATQQASFFADAHAAGVNDLGLALLAAQRDDLFDKKGKVDFAEMKQLHPLLFVPASGGKPTPGNGGKGMGGKTPKPVNMNDWIRGDPDSS